MSDGTLTVPANIKELVEGFAPDKLSLEAFETRIDGVWQSVTYGEVQDQVRAIGNALLELGIAKGDRIGILSENRNEWPIAYLAVSSIGATVVNMDIFWKVPELVRVLETAQPRMVFTSAAFVGKIKAAREGSPSLEHVICFDDHDALGRDGHLHLRALLDRGKTLLESGTDLTRSVHIAPDDVATLIFLSTGTGVNLTHRGLMANLEGFLPDMTEADSLEAHWLGLLPFHHAWPTTVALLFPVWTYSRVSMLTTTKMDVVLETVRQRKIDFVMLVPVLVERLYEHIHHHAKRAGLFDGLELPAASPMTDAFDAALREGRRRKILSRTLVELGVTCPKCIWSAGAHLFASAESKVRRLGVNLVNAYGLTETSPIVSHSTPTYNRMRAAGRVLPNIEVKIDRPDKYGNGEILVRGDILMGGYYEDPEETRKVIDADGWLHSGDLGMVDDDRYLYITGRLKNVIVTPGGKNIYPAELEPAISQSPYVAHVVVTPRIVDIDEFPHAHIQVDLDALNKLEREQSKRFTDGDVRALIQGEIQSTTESIAAYKLPKDFSISYEPLDEEALRTRVLYFDEPQRTRRHAVAAEAGAEDEEPTGIGEQALTSTIASYLLDKVSDIFDGNPPDIDLEMSFFGYLSSLEIVEISATIEREVQVKLYPPMLFEHINIPSLAGYFASEFRAAFIAFLGEERIAAAPTDGITALLQTGRRVRKQLRTAAQRRHAHDDPIAIVGVAGVFPGSPTLEELWEHLENGDDLITEIPEERFDWREYDGDPLSESNKMNTHWGGFIDDMDKFDPAFFGISPKEARMMDPQQRIFMETVWKALEDAGQQPSALSGENVGVFAGVTAYDYMDIVRRSTSDVGVHMYTGTFPSVLPHRISYLLGIHGPSEVVDTACSSALVAIHRAKQAMLAGECDMAIAGGVNALLTPELFLSFARAGMLSPTGRCKTFSNKADGYVRGEGVGVVVLKPLSRALEEQDHIYAVIKGSAVNHGGRASSFTSPNPLAQASLLVSAHEDAGIDPESVSYIEAHGTGTPLGDPIEINGLKKAFGELFEAQGRAPTTHFCGVGSIKTNIGHLESAAGIAGVIKVLLAMKHRKLPPSIHCDELSEYVELEGSPFYVTTELKAWDRPLGPDAREFPRRAGVSSFGVGGANAHVILEEFEDDQPTDTQADTAQLVVLSAKKEEQLLASARNLADFLARSLRAGADGLRLRDVAFTLQTGRNAMSERLALVATSTAELREQLASFAAGETAPTLHQGSLGKKPGDGTGTLDVSTDALARALEERDLDTLARLWTAGANVPWERLYASATPRRVSLPTYPFARKHCWVKT
ncbi:MAG: beta-ketoacyl synthase N-terminal-like domain-containing protein [bacterium]